MNTFGQRLKTLRKSKNLTQEELASIFYINKTSISRYENNSQFPEMDLLIQLANFFDVSIDYLLGRTDESVLLSSHKTKVPIETSDDFTKILKTLNAFSKIQDNNVLTIVLENKKKLNLTLDELDFFVRYFDFLGIDLIRILKKFNPEDKNFQLLNQTDECVDILGDITTNIKRYR